jgi:ATP-binding cassette subfamily B protein
VADALTVSAFLRLSGRIGQDVLLDLRERVFARIQRLSLAFHERYTSGRVISRLTSDLDFLQEMLDKGLDGFFISLLSILGIGAVLLMLDVPLGLVALAGFVPLALLTRWYRRRSQHGYRATRTWIARVIVQFVETMNGIRAVQAFRREQRNSAIMDGLSGEFGDAETEALYLVARFTSIVQLVGSVCVAVTLLFGALRVLQGSLTLGVLAAFVLYLRRFYDPLDELAMFANSYASAAAALEKISGLLDERSTVSDPVTPVALPVPVRGKVVFDGVRFSYGGPDILPALDLVIPAGQTIALVGATGAGKSTVAKLVARFYDPVAGAIRLDGG